MGSHCGKSKYSFDRGDGRIVHYCSEKDCKKGFKAINGSSCYENSGNSSGRSY